MEDRGSYMRNNNDGAWPRRHASPSIGLFHLSKCKVTDVRDATKLSQGKPSSSIRR